MNYEQYMRVALQLAEKAGEEVHPNPKVGALLVYQNEIIGQGYHRGPGLAHAEEQALKDAIEKENRDLLSKSILFCTLEPCCCIYEGKHREACTNLIIANSIPEVVIATLDPNPHVRGKGLAMLRKKNITVHLGVCAKEAISMNLKFFADQLSKEQ